MYLYVYTEQCHGDAPALPVYVFCVVGNVDRIVGFNLINLATQEHHRGSGNASQLPFDENNEPEVFQVTSVFYFRLVLHNANCCWKLFVYIKYERYVWVKL